jgi:tetratricopeptide (TPR) repeat protein
MLEQVAAAFEQKDYQTAKKLLKQLFKEFPHDPGVLLYVAKLQEVSGKYEDAEKFYRRLLQEATNTKIIAQARQGLQNLQKIERERQQKAIAEVTGNAGNREPGLLILEPISSDRKPQAALDFARIMQIDPYSARLKLPSRGWRFYKTAAVGELEFFGQQLQQANIPCFWTALPQIPQIQVFQVDHFQESTSQATVVCRNHLKQVGSMSFDWSEVSAIVMGRLPIFEEVVDRNARGKLERKTKTLDYAEFCDLHLPRRNCIMRSHDGSYQFDKGITSPAVELQDFPQLRQNTVHTNWQNLLRHFQQKLPQTQTWSDFTTFAETILDQNEILNRLESHIHLLRTDKTPWDSAFHLYSGLVFSNHQNSTCPD